jgi:hypothetical protein
VVTDNGGTVIAMLSPFDAVRLPLSVTLTVKLEDPPAVGVPLITPPALSVKPPGNEPVEIVHVFPPLPPVAVSVWEYAVPKVPPGSDPVVIASGAGLIVTTYACESVEPSLSVIFTLKLKLPAAVGVPLIVPCAASIFNPSGSEPALIVKTNGCFPPDVAMAWLYAVPTVPAGSEVVVMFTLAA